MELEPVVAPKSNKRKWPCLFEECQEKQDHSSGKCATHRKTRCDDCKKFFTSYKHGSTSSPYCSPCRHKINRRQGRRWS